MPDIPQHMRLSFEDQRLLEWARGEYVRQGKGDFTISPEKFDELTDVLKRIPRWDDEKQEYYLSRQTYVDVAVWPREHLMFQAVHCFRGPESESGG